MRRQRVTDIIAPSAKSILFCMFLSFFLWQDIFWPQQARVIENISNIGKSPLFLFIEQTLPVDGFVGRIAGLALYLLLCFLIMNLNEVFSFIRVRTILPSLFCLIMGGLLLRPHHFSPGIIVALLVLSALFFSFKLLTKENPKYAFNVALLLSVAALFSFSCIWFLVVFWWFTYLSNMFSLRIFLASLLGALAPCVYAVIGFYGNESLLLEYVKQSFQPFSVHFFFSIPEIIYLVFIGCLTLLALFFFLLRRSQENIRPRREFTYIILFFLLTLFFIVLAFPDSYILFWLLIVFGSYLIGYYFSLANSRFSRILLMLYFAGSILLFLFD